MEGTNVEKGKRIARNQLCLETLKQLWGENADLDLPDVMSHERILQKAWQAFQYGSPGIHEIVGFCKTMMREATGVLFKAMGEAAE